MMLRKPGVLEGFIGGPTVGRNAFVSPDSVSPVRLEHLWAPDESEGSLQRLSTDLERLPQNHSVSSQE